MSSDTVKARLRNWLRSEQAMGLHSVPISHAGAVVPPAAAVESTLQAPPPAAGLFGQESDAPDPLAELFAAPPLSTAEKQAALDEMNAREVSVCKKCRLCEARTHTVFGEGSADAQIVFIGEGPGETEDQTGRPFVGRAGQLLDKMIAGMGLQRPQVFICNIVKCRPPGNRVPAPEEVISCTPYLVRQISIIRPKVIVTLGLPAAKYMLSSSTTMGRLRGQWQNWRGIKLMPTYHPAFLLRSYTEQNRAAVWSDLKQVMAEVGLKQEK